VRELNIHRGSTAALSLALALGACSGATSAPPPQIDPNIYPAKYRSQIADFMRTYLNNPTKVRDAYVSEPALKPVGGTNHYVVCVRYNPRDTQNRYTGNEDRIAVFWGGRVNQFLPGNPVLCANAAYQRFPEIEAMVP
jgi:hypothetical protein